VIGYGGNEAAAQQAAEECTRVGGKSEIVQFDVGHADAAEAAVTDVAKRLGKLDVLVASAGISIDALLLRLKEDDFDRVLAVNLKGAVACARAAIKPMMRARSGRVIFLSSVVGEMGNAGQTMYAASKAALLGVMKSLAREYASRGITVNAIAPGFIETDMTHNLPEEAKSAMLGAIPLGRIGTVDDVAAAVLYLASQEAAYVTGQTLRVNGGMYV
jgi:3-oxoacyl-[acyl-carrier protein] reductase